MVDPQVLAIPVGLEDACVHLAGKQVFRMEIPAKVPVTDKIYPKVRVGYAPSYQILVVSILNYGKIFPGQITSE